MIASQSGPNTKQDIDSSGNEISVIKFQVNVTEITSTTVKNKKKDCASEILTLENARINIMYFVRELKYGLDCAQCYAAKSLWYEYCKEPVYLSLVAAAGAIPPLVHLLSVGSDRTKRVTAGALRSLTSDRERRMDIIAAGAIPPLVQLLSNGIEEARHQAAGALEALSRDPGGAKLVIVAGAIPPLVLLLLGETEKERTVELAVEVLRNLAFDAEHERLIGAAGAIPPIVRLLRDGTPYGQREAARALISLGADQENKRIIVAEGAVSLLVNLLRVGVNSDSAQRSAAGALTQLAAFSSETKDAIAAAGAIPLLVQLLREGGEDVKRRAVCALKSLAFCGRCASAMVEEGVLSLLMAHVQNPSRKLGRVCTGALWSIGSHIDIDAALSEFSADTIASLLSALCSSDEAVGNTALGLLSIVSAVTAVEIAAAGGLRPLERQLARDPAQLLPAARSKLLRLKKQVDAVLAVS